MSKKVLLLGILTPVIAVMLVTGCASPLPSVTETSTVLIPMDIDELTGTAETILIGRVQSILSVQGGLDEPGPYKVTTDVVIEVEQYLKNRLGTDEVIVRTQGGKIPGEIWCLPVDSRLTDGELLQKMLLMPSSERPQVINYHSHPVWFEEGERVLLFLAKGPGDEFWTVGRWQGKYTLDGDMADNKDQARNIGVSNLIGEIEELLGN